MNFICEWNQIKPEPEIIWNEIRRTMEMSFPNEWKPIQSAPENTWVEICGPSGYKNFPYFIAIAKYNPDRYHDSGCWEDVTGAALSECGWVPKFWREPESKLFLLLLNNA